jgi:hypothetical protein
LVSQVTVTPEQWISQLGDNSYFKREQAARRLKEMDAAVLPLLKQASEEQEYCDPEIKYRAKVLIDEIIYPDLPEADDPTYESVWDLPNRYRYTEVDGFTIDNALTIYTDAWEAYVQRQTMNKQSWGLHIVRYKELEVESQALATYLATQRLAGMPMKEYVELCREIKTNRRTCFHVSRADSWGAYEEPSPVLTRQVIEGVQ